MNHRRTRLFAPSLALVAICGCPNDPEGDAGLGGGTFGTTSSAGQGGNGFGPETDAAVYGTSGTTTGGATGTTGSGGGAVALSDICGGDLPTSDKFEISFHGHPSTAAAQYARAMLLRPVPLVPDPTLLRSEDFLSFYGLDAMTAANNQIGPLAVRWYQTGQPDLSSRGVLEIDFVAPPSQRDALRLVVLVDVSQSVGQGLALSHDAVRALARGMAASAMPGDTMAVLTFAGDVKTEVDGPVQAGGQYGGLPIDALALGVRAGDDFGSGVRESIKAAENGATAAHVVLLTDGGTSLDASLLEDVRAAASNGTRLSVAQVAIALPSGPAPLARAFLEQLAGAGRGGQFYVSQVSDADRAFDSRFGSSFGVYARAAVAKIELPSLLAAVGLPAAPMGSADGPTGGLLGGDAVHPLRIGLEAACPAVFASDIPGLTLDVTLSGSVAGGTSDLGAVNGDWLIHRGPSDLTKRNDAILAVTQALRSRSAEDIGLAREALLAVKGGSCLECEQVDELQAMLDAID